MAQSQRVAALTDELIQAIVHFSPETNKRAYRHAKEIAARGLRAHHYNRTNQFEVEKSYQGLDEKFRILNRDDLADALKDRLTELQEVTEVPGKRNRWLPEYLSLLLQLSDKPTENDGVEALELLRPKTPEQPLTWKEILDADPYSDEDIWRDIDYAEESSEDEEDDLLALKQKKAREESPPTSVDEDDIFDPEDCVVPTDSEILGEIEEAQFWKASVQDETGTVEITELQAVRETLFMLGGFPTSLYVIEDHGNIRVNPKYVLSHAMEKTMDHLFSQLAATGRSLYRLRQWTKRPSSLPLIQTFETAVQRRLVAYDKALAELQRDHLVPDTPIAVSLLDVRAKVQLLSGPLLRLSDIVAEIEPQLHVNPFVHLETLFQQATLAQMTLEQDRFVFFSELFFECLQTYLKPIRRWMESGELGTNDETFFVFEDDSGSETSSLWHDRFVLRRGKGDALRSPTFLEPAALKIFNTGKSLVFLKELGLYDTISDAVEREPSLDHATVCGTSAIPISPFPELFQAAFETWIRSKYSLASSILRTHLVSQCGLLHILSNFHIIYFAADGSGFQDFANAVFERMDSQRRGWNDRFLLTELARGIYATVLNKADAEKIIVRSARTSSQSQSVKGLSSITIDYALHWPIQNIIQRFSLPIYHQLFTLLLQTYRAKYLLQSIRLSSIAHNAQALRLRARLLWFIDILRSYLCETVIARSYADMVAAMTEAKDIDEMSNVHVRFLARVQEQAFLSHNLKTIHRSVIEVLDLCVQWNQACERIAHAKTKAMGDSQAQKTQGEKKTKPKLGRRKSVIPAIVENVEEGEEDEEGSDEESHGREQRVKHSVERRQADLHTVGRDFARLLPFITAGLKNIGRVGAEEVWERLAERLEGGMPGLKRV